MALSSPGVQVSVTDESFYTPAEPGTVPLIIVATAENKTNGAGTGTAPGTTAANAGTVYLMTSQKDLVDTFGDPVFKTDSNNNPIHAGEQNEYGLQTAYSLLGVSNAAFIVRADVDLDELEAQTDAPGANPTNGQWWIDTQATTWGIQEWNGAAATVAGGQKFTYKVPLVLTDADFPSKIVGNAPLEGVAIIVVCDDANFTAASLNNYLWVTYTRSNPSHDMYGIGSSTINKHWGCTGPLVIDARIKPHHAPVLIKDEAVEKRVDRLFEKGGSLYSLISTQV